MLNVTIALSSLLAVGIIALAIWGFASEHAAGGFDRDYAALLVSKGYRDVTSRYDNLFPKTDSRPRSVVYPRVAQAA